MKLLTQKVQWRVRVGLAKFSNLNKHQLTYQLDKLAKVFNKVNDKERLSHLDVLLFLNFYNEFCDVISGNFPEKFYDSSKCW